MTVLWRSIKHITNLRIALREKNTSLQSCWIWDSVSVFQHEILGTKIHYRVPLNTKPPSPVHLKLIQFTKIQYILNFSGAHLPHTMEYTCKSLFIPQNSNFPKNIITYIFGEKQKINAASCECRELNECFLKRTTLSNDEDHNEDKWQTWIVHGLRVRGSDTPLENRDLTTLSSITVTAQYKWCIPFRFLPHNTKTSPSWERIILMIRKWSVTPLWWLPGADGRPSFLTSLRPRRAPCFLAGGACSHYRGCPSRLSASPEISRSQSTSREACDRFGKDFCSFRCGCVKVWTRGNNQLAKMGCGDSNNEKPLFWGRMETENIPNI